MKKANLAKELKFQNNLIKIIRETDEERAENIWRMWTTMIARLRNCDCLSSDEYDELWIALNKDIAGIFNY